MKSWKVDPSWSVFLDRDGVINHRIMGDYVKHVEEFQFLDKVPEAIGKLASFFRHVFVVTNQQGIGKGVMTHEQLKRIHQHMIDGVKEQGGHISAVYYAPNLKTDNNTMRKPLGGMGMKAKADFPEIDFKKSIMVGDSDSDILFGKNLGMKTVRIKTVEPIGVAADMTCTSLVELTEKLIK
jgi:histidinol-phosphate phosphatase family protein